MVMKKRRKGSSLACLTHLPAKASRRSNLQQEIKYSGKTKEAATISRAASFVFVFSVHSLFLSLYKLV
jgi:hypothetical protein